MDERGRLLADVVLSRGHSLMLSARKIAAIIQLLDADSMLLAHNHPSGICEPSEADVKTTRGIVRTLSALGATLHDHIIVTRVEAFSFRAAGYL